MHTILEKIQPKNNQISLFNALYPIERKLKYYDLFGQLGFHEYQVVIPHSKIDFFIKQLREILKKDNYAITLASAKAFREKNSLLRFTGDGVCFALNFPRNHKAKALLSYLDALTIEAQGIPNIIKDSRLPRVVIDSCYKDADRFRKLLLDFDPKRLFRSELSNRLEL